MFQEFSRVFFMPKAGLSGFAGQKSGKEDHHKCIFRIFAFIRYYGK